MAGSLLLASWNQSALREEHDEEVLGKYSHFFPLLSILSPQLVLTVVTYVAAGTGDYTGDQNQASASYNFGQFCKFLPCFPSQLNPDKGVCYFHSHDFLFLFQALILAQPTAAFQILVFFVSMR